MISSSHTINIQALSENHRAAAYSDIAGYTFVLIGKLSTLSLPPETTAVDRSVPSPPPGPLPLHTSLIEADACGTQLYDHFLNLGEEINLIWTTPWNAGKILYYAAKYPAFLDGAFILYCTTRQAHVMFCTN
ncbi:hypothetical protein BU17DRAFT_68880 [Hysterangium stoloniferum]|nr:hypothetical protein BU17DRAFT_68880 [Hysterangium stoloniferum]